MPYACILRPMIEEMHAIIFEQGHWLVITWSNLSHTIIKYIIEGWLVMPIKGSKVLEAKHSISQAINIYILITTGKWVKKGCIWIWRSEFCYVLYFSLGFVKVAA